MRRYCLGAALVIALVATESIRSDTKANAQDQRIGELIKQLGSSRFSAREKARHELEVIGEPALAALRQATKSPDLETSRRATEIVRVLEEKLSAAKMLAPKYVHLKLKEMPVRDAIKELEKQSGYTIQVQGDPDERKITLDTGKITFWEALDQLCVRAGLMETPQRLMPGQPVGFPGIRQPGLPGGILPVVPPPVPPKKGPILQLQAAAAAQVQPPPVPPAGMPFPGGFGGMPTGSTGVIALAPGKIPPTCYAGSVRIRLISQQRPGPGEVRLSLNVAAEPRVQSFSLDGSPRVEIALDDQAQKLEALTETRREKQGVVANMARPAPGMWTANPMMAMIVRQTVVRFKLGEKEARSLKDFKGTLPAKCLGAMEPLMTVENVLKAAGKTVKDGGGSIHVQGIDKTDKGDYQIKIRMENPPGLPGAMMPGGMFQMQQIQIQIGGNVGGNVIIGGGMPMGNRLPLLVDKDGKSYRVVSMPSMRMSFNNGQMSQEATLVFHADNGQGPPDRLVYNGQRTVGFSVPFQFKDVPF